MALQTARPEIERPASSRAFDLQRVPGLFLVPQPGERLDRGSIGHPYASTWSSGEEQVTLVFIEELFDILTLTS